MVVFGIEGCSVLLVINFAGPVHTMFTVTGTSTAGLNSTVQVRLTLDPIGRTGLTRSLVTVTETGSGTISKDSYYLNKRDITLILLLVTYIEV